MINEEKILTIIENFLTEEVSKVNRNDYSKVLFKMDELESQINETIKELRKLQDLMPEGLKTISGGRLKSIEEGLSISRNTLGTLRNKIRLHRKNNKTNNHS
jgi:translation initiation factor RLI1